MHIKTLVCDLDGTLLAPGGGIRLSDTVADALISLQKKGVTLVLASARIFQGILPIALQLQMDHYQGYIIAQNGTMGYDVANKKVLFLHDIKKEDSLFLWNTAIQLGLDFAIAQPSYMIASGYSEGFYLDHKNCEIDYLITDRPSIYVKDEIWKCAASQKKEVLDTAFIPFQQEVNGRYPYQLVRSTDTIIDIVKEKCTKENGLQELFALTGQSFATAAAIGDGNSDAKMIQHSAYGVTLENGSALCKQYAKQIVPSYREEGCLSLFQALLNAKKA